MIEISQARIKLDRSRSLNSSSCILFVSSLNLQLGLCTNAGIHLEAEEPDVAASLAMGGKGSLRLLSFTCCSEVEYQEHVERLSIR